MTLTAALDHSPTRPDWRCSACLNEWPCEDAKLRLAAIYASAPTALIIYLAKRQLEAIDDATLNPRSGIKCINSLRRRFVEWTDSPEYRISA